MFLSFNIPPPIVLSTSLVMPYIAGHPFEACEMDLANTEISQIRRDLYKFTCHLQAKSLRSPGGLWQFLTNHFVLSFINTLSNFIIVTYCSAETVQQSRSCTKTTLTVNRTQSVLKLLENLSSTLSEQSLSLHTHHTL